MGICELLLAAGGRSVGIQRLRISLGLECLGAIYWHLASAIYAWGIGQSGSLQDGLACREGVS